MTEVLNSVQTWLNENPLAGDLLAMAGILILSYIAFIITNRVVLRVVKNLAKRTKSKVDDYIVNSKTLERASYLVPLLVIDLMSPLIPNFALFISKVVHLLLIWVVLRSLSSLLNAMNMYYETKSRAKERPIKGYIQVTIIALYVIGIIIMIGILTGQSIWVLFSGIGAMTAIVLLIFRDTLLSFVAGIQITSYDLIRVGDWIEMPAYGADGDVVDIALHTIKVQNWDKTITVIPTYKITENSFKNWRGMQMSGGRRIKRPLYIDQNSIKLCTPEMLEKFRRIHLLTDYIDRKQKELEEYNRKHHIDDSVLVNGRRMTNIGTFRAYALEYLKHHPKLRHDMTTMVRQLPPGPNGLPMEIYVFTSDTVWENYEAIQGDIFDHLLSIVPEFELRIFQNPSGRDFREALEARVMGNA